MSTVKVPFFQCDLSMKMTLCYWVALNAALKSLCFMPLSGVLTAHRERRLAHSANRRGSQDIISDGKCSMQIFQKCLAVCTDHFYVTDHQKCDIRKMAQWRVIYRKHTLHRYNKNKNKTTWLGRLQELQNRTECLTHNPCQTVHLKTT